MQLKYSACVAVLTVIACGDDGSAQGGTTGSALTSTGGATSPDDGGDDGATMNTPGPDDDAGPTTGPGSSTTAPGTMDAADSDASGPGGVGCDAADYIVCEDFEGAAVGENPEGWGLRESGVFGGNGMGVTDEDAALGSQSFRLNSGESGAQWLNYMGDISMLADGHWGRMFVRMGTPVPWPAGGVIHGDLVEARGNWRGSTHQVRWAAIENAQMQHNWGYNVQTSNAGEFIHETSYIYTWPDAWFCLEWHHDQATQQATLWIDDEEVLAVTAADDPQMPTFDDISVGWANYQPASPEFVVYLDEVVLDDARIGCER